MGIIQGVTEFLPISSSGHLVLFSKITGSHSSMTFDLSLHLATVLAVVVCYKKQIVAMVRHPLSKPSTSLVIATVVTAIFVFILRPFAEQSFSGDFICVTFALSALLLLLTLVIKRKNATTSPSFLQSAVIGASQGLAVFPGLSRSATVFFTGNAVGLEKERNTTFTFLLSLPIIVGSMIVSIIEGGFASVPLHCLIVGFCSAFVSGLLSLKLIRRVFCKQNLMPFVIYLCLLSAFLLLNDNLLHLF